VIGDENASTLKPCPVCRAQEFDRWAKGHYMPRGAKEVSVADAADPDTMTRGLSEARMALGVGA
jgi:hypothetical protein